MPVSTVVVVSLPPPAAIFSQTVDEILGWPRTPYSPDRKIGKIPSTHVCSTWSNSLELPAPVVHHLRLRGRLALHARTNSLATALAVYRLVMPVDEG